VLQTFPYPDYGRNFFDAVGFHLSYEMDSRDVETNPENGYYFKVRTGVYPEFLDVDETFLRAWFDARGYWTAKSFAEMTFALRAGGGKTWGKYPYYAAHFLGGAANLRGYSRERFSGDAALFGQAEVRMYLGNIRLIIPGRIGINFFGETGRVYAKNENSDKWHPAYGGGVFLTYLGRMLTVAINVANSSEKLGVFVTTGMMF
jgi:outer membrane translocation and assembly module TamA